MALPGTYPLPLAAGVGLAGRFDPFDLYAGERDIISGEAQVAPGVAISQFQVLSFDVNGCLTPYTGVGEAYASGTVTFSGPCTAGDTVTINGVPITFVAIGSSAEDIALNTDYPTTDAYPYDLPTVDVGPVGDTGVIAAQNFVNAINGTVDATDEYTLYPQPGLEPIPLVGVTASLDATGLIVTLSAIAPGTPGDVTLTKVSTNIAVSGAALTGGGTESDVEPDKPIGIAATAAAAATPGIWIPYFMGGVFNHQVLHWPPAVATLAQRKRAVAGSSLSIGQLL